MGITTPARKVGARAAGKKVVWDGSMPLLEQIKERSRPFQLPPQEQAQRYALLDPQTHKMVDAMTELARKAIAYKPALPGGGFVSKKRKIVHVDIAGAPPLPA